MRWVFGGRASPAPTGRGWTARRRRAEASRENTTAYPGGVFPKTGRFHLGTSADGTSNIAHRDYRVSRQVPPGGGGRAAQGRPGGNPCGSRPCQPGINQTRPGAVEAKAEAILPPRRVRRGRDTRRGKGWEIKRRPAPSPRNIGGTAENVWGRARQPGGRAARGTVSNRGARGAGRRWKTTVSLQAAPSWNHDGHQRLLA